MVASYGLWPGVVGFANDAQLICVECAFEIYGRKVINDVIDGKPGYEQHTDNEGNPFNVLLADSEDVKGERCMISDCGEPLSDDEEEEEPRRNGFTFDDERM